MDQDREDASDVHFAVRAFDLVGQMASLLHAAGDKEVAALLDAMSDVGQLVERRKRRDGSAGLIPEGGAALDYALDQLADLAATADARGMTQTATLFRAPGAVIAAGRDSGPSGRQQSFRRDARGAPLRRSSAG